MRAPLHLDPDYSGAVALAEKRFLLMKSDFKEFEEVIRRGLSFGRPVDRAEDKIQLISSGFFSEELFVAMICGGQSFKPMFAVWMWEKLKERRIFFRATSPSMGLFADHHIDTVVIFEHLDSKTFKNLFFGPGNLRNTYSNSIIAIDVKKNGSLFRGSGFIVQQSEHASRWLITCRHNIDSEQGIEIENLSTCKNQSIEIGKIHISKKFDLAVAELISINESPSFRLFSGYEIFDSVFTMGFPNVPCANADLIGHRGELNGIAELYLQKHEAIIISNYVAPGSSGCPVLRDDGLCIGMTIKWLEGEWEGERARFSAALPAKDIGGFINEIGGI